MKKAMPITLFAVMLIVLSACAAKVSLQVSPPPGASVESPDPTEESSAPETSNAPVSPSQNPYEAVGMPIPVPIVVDGDTGDNSAFGEPYTFKLELYDPMFSDFARYLGITTKNFDASLETFGDWWSQKNSSNLLDRINLFALIIEFDIPNEVVAESIKKHNEMNEDFAVQYGDLLDLPGNAADFRDRKFTDAEMEALLSRDTAKVLEQFATEYSIVIGDKVYSPMWLYLHTPEDYANEGIAPEMVEEKLDSFSDLYLTDEAFRAFGDKLSDFTGESVTLEGRPAD